MPENIYLLCTDTGLGCRFLPRPKHGGSGATTLPAAPPALPTRYLEVIRRERRDARTRTPGASLRLTHSPGDETRLSAPR